MVQAGFNYLRVWTLGRVGEGIVADLRKRLFSHLLDLSPAFFQPRKTGEITSRLTSDVDTMQQVVSTALAQFVNQAVTLLGGVAALLVIDACLTLAMLAVVPAVILGARRSGGGCAPCRRRVRTVWPTRTPTRRRRSPTSGW